MRVGRGIVAGAGIGAAVLAGVVWAVRPRAVEVETAPAVRGAMRVTVDAEGLTRVRERYVVAAPVTGRVRRAKLYYLRKLSGKAARIREKREG